MEPVYGSAWQTKRTKYYNITKKHATKQILINISGIANGGNMPRKVKMKILTMILISAFIGGVAIVIKAPERWDACRIYGAVIQVGLNEYYTAF